MSFLVEVFYRDDEVGINYWDCYGPFRQHSNAQRFADNLELRTFSAQAQSEHRTVIAKVAPLKPAPKLMPVVHEARAFLHGEHTPKEEPR